jgi:hypothetical protein
MKRFRVFVRRFKAGRRQFVNALSALFRQKALSYQHPNADAALQ